MASHARTMPPRDGCVSDDEPECPICVEKLDIGDRSFFPCPCGYQICGFCWNQIRTELQGLCPACRRPYSDESTSFVPPSPTQLTMARTDRRQRQKNRAAYDGAAASTDGLASSTGAAGRGNQREREASGDRKHLAGVRVLQRNLVYVIGLSLRIAEPRVLESNEYFGRFGPILKAVVNQHNVYQSAAGSSVSAYITYRRQEDAEKCVAQMDGVVIDGHVLRCVAVRVF